MNNERLKLLLVASSPADCDELRAVLLEEGESWFELCHEPDPGRALRRLDAGGAIDVIVLDLNVDGNTDQPHPFACLWQGANGIPIVIQTTLENTHAAIQCCHQGAMDYLVKGHNRGHVLRRVLMQVIDRHLEIAQWSATQADRLTKTEKVALIDRLTGFFNMHYLRTRLLQEMCRADRYHYPLSLVMLELEHEGASGPGAVDGSILATIAAVIKHTCRESDMLGRHENRFCVVLPFANAAMARRVAERLRHCIERTLAQCGGEGAAQGLACHVGVAEHHSQLTGSVSFFNLAEKDLAATRGDRGSANANSAATSTYFMD